MNLFERYLTVWFALLVEAPVMLLVVQIANASGPWYVYRKVVN